MYDIASRPKGGGMMPPPGLQICLQPHDIVTVIFDLLTPKVDSFMPLPRGPLLPVFIEIGLFIFKISYWQVLDLLAASRLGLQP